ncbi:hypothetical protein [Thermodesulfatator autotrophicus]|uniref:DUF4007 domain-containing protein n=1 Tax=Thermodesulfatator autotrophicus TaxID=1795632 RepID=A0A177E7G9_9BACT|nr:hypothetical protein [Thermodesulfatator autotrophicus]OAG27656.1 hypothetical protein TH606_05965 [Thermodesulfatator autotrophicus]
MTWQGFYKHQTFGLRKEWLALWLTHPKDWEEVGGLGPRQVDSLRVWLKTTGLLDKEGKPTPLAQAFKEQGLEELALWEKLWVNVVFNFATARWYVLRLGKGSWSISELLEKLAADFPHYKRRTLKNGLQELVGLLERTPVGKELQQGKVERKGRQREISREGYPYLSEEAVKLALQRLNKETGRDRFRLDEELPFPWIIFGGKPKDLFRQLMANGRPLFSLDGETFSLKEL